MQLIIIALQFFYQLERHLSLCHIKKSVLFVNIYVVNIYVVKIYAAEVVHSTKEFVSSVMFSPTSIIHDEHMTAHCPIQRSH